MSLVKRKVTYQLYPSDKQQNKMLETLRLHQKLYNAALEQRIDAHKRCGVSLGYNDQARELTQLRAEIPEYRNLSAQPAQVTLKRLDKAKKSFFQRLKAGKKKPGFPRFKSLDRYKGWGYAAHGDGWKWLPGKDFVNGSIRISCIGMLQSRGRARFLDEDRTNHCPGKPKTMEIIRKIGKWYAAITFESEVPFRASGEEAVGIDWGTCHFLTMVDESQTALVIENPRHLKSSEDKLEKAQRDLSRKKKGSSNHKKAKRALARAHERVAWKRSNFLHQTSVKIDKSARLIATEALNIGGITANGGVYKAGSCSGCGKIEKKQLAERVHDCKQCGLMLDRDVNTAIVILNFALTGFITGREPALSVGVEQACSAKHETLSISSQALQSA